MKNKSVFSFSNLPQEENVFFEKGAISYADLTEDSEFILLIDEVYDEFSSDLHCEHHYLHTYEDGNRLIGLGGIPPFFEGGPRRPQTSVRAVKVGLFDRQNVSCKECWMTHESYEKNK